MERLMTYSALAVLLLVSACGKQGASDKEAKLSPVDSKQQQEQKVEQKEEAKKEIGKDEVLATHKVEIDEALLSNWKEFDAESNSVMSGDLPREAGAKSFVRFAGAQTFDLASELKGEEAIEGQKGSRKTFTLSYTAPGDKGDGKQQQEQLPQTEIVGEMVLETVIVEQEPTQQQGQGKDGKEDKVETVEKSRLVLTKLCSAEYADRCEVRFDKGRFSAIALMGTGSTEGKGEQKPEQEQGKPEQGKPEQGKPEQGKPEQVVPEQGKPEQGKPEQGKPEQVVPEQGKPEQGKPEQGKPEQGKPEQGKPEQGKPEQGKPEQGKPEQDKPQQP